jgi:hypothetical protein
MCKIPNETLGIKRPGFGARRGKFTAVLTDGREITVPVSMFPDIQTMSLKKRDEWIILDNQYFTFEHMSRAYSVLDLLKIKGSMMFREKIKTLLSNLSLSLSLSLYGMGDCGRLG